MDSKRNMIQTKNETTINLIRVNNNNLLFYYNIDDAIPLYKICLCETQRMESSKKLNSGHKLKYK